jgi:hypothetical protein
MPLINPQQQIIWTAIPNGIVETPQGKRLRLAIFVTPRLRLMGSSPTLGQTVFDNWVDKLAGIQLSAVFDNPKAPGQPIVVATEPDDGPGTVAPTNARWTSVFPSTTPVEPLAQPTFEARTIQSFSAKPVLKYIAENYGAIGFHVPKIDLPRPGAILGTEKAPFSFAKLRGAALAPALEGLSKLKRGINQELVQPGGPSVDFARVLYFHKGAPAQQKPMMLKMGPPKPPDFDFHDEVAALGQFPAVLRALGLVIDRLVPIASVPKAGGALAVRVGVVAPGLDATHVRPKTAYEIVESQNRFAAVPKSPQASDAKQGMLRFDDPARFALIQVDAEGATLKLANYVASVERSVQLHGQAAPPVTVPSMRSAGISVVKPERHKEFYTLFDAVAKKNAAVTTSVDAVGKAKTDGEAVKMVEAIGGAVVLYEEDLTRGIRVDVREVAGGTPGPWMSLCRRTETHVFTATGETLAPDGQEGVVTTGATEVASPIPGNDPDLKIPEALFRWAGWSLTAPPPASSKDTVTATLPSQLSSKFGITSKVGVPAGSLPRLRFGRDYQFRARLTDLAGGGLGPDAPGEVTNPPERYYRYDPVTSPVVVLREPLHQGNAAIPGREGESSNVVAIRSTVGRTTAQFRQENPGLSGLREVAERWIAPPKVENSLALAHGLLDSGDAAVMQKFVDDKSFGEVEGAAVLGLPYLADPKGPAAVFWVPGGAPNAIPFWPKGAASKDAKPFLLRLAEATDGKISYDVADGTPRVVTLRLPKAERVTVRLSTALIHHYPSATPEMQAEAEAALRDLGQWKWIEDCFEVLQLDNKQELYEANRFLTLAGMNWTLNPFTLMTFVHAVREPLVVPTLGAEQFNISRELGDTHAKLVGFTPIHGKSTLKVDFTAEWSEWIDDLAAEGPEQVTQAAHVFEVPIQLGGAEVVVNEGPTRYFPANEQLRIDGSRHELGDTKYRRIVYRATAATRFREFFPRSGPIKVMKKSNEPGPPDEGSSKYVQVSAPAPRDVWNTARPAAPKVLYVVPSFGWSDNAPRHGDDLSRRRVGGGLRVYLDRPWYSSGDGELLGAVLLPPGASVTSQTQPYVTRWGIDPIWSAAPVEDLPTADRFVDAVTADGLVLEELPGGPTVAVAAYAPVYDPDRRLWYCDLQIDPGQAYYPFVRLALARYQPRSVPGAELSRVVLAEFAQLAPDRMLSVSRGALGAVNVSVTGSSYSGTFNEERTSEVQVSVERQTRPGGADLGWEPVPDSAVVLTHQRITAPPAPTIEGMKKTHVSMDVWRGSVSLPGEPSLGRFRLVVKELETYVRDVRAGDAGEGRGRLARPSNVATRVVYADTYVL